jgi:hypothetical protein
MSLANIASKMFSRPMPKGNTLPIEMLSDAELLELAAPEHSALKSLIEQSDAARAELEKRESARAAEERLADRLRETGARDPGTPPARAMLERICAPDGELGERVHPFRLPAVLHRASALALFFSVVLHMVKTDRYRAVLRLFSSLGVLDAYRVGARAYAPATFADKLGREQLASTAVNDWGWAQGGEPLIDTRTEEEISRLAGRK